MSLLAIGSITQQDERFARSGNIGDRGGPGRWNSSGIVWRGSGVSTYLINNGQSNGYWYYDDYLLDLNGKSGNALLRIEAPLWTGTIYRGYNQAGTNAKDSLDKAFGTGTYDREYPEQIDNGESQLDIYRLEADGTVTWIGPGQVGRAGGNIELQSTQNYVLRVSARKDGYTGNYKLIDESGLIAKATELSKHYSDEKIYTPEPDISIVSVTVGDVTVEEGGYARFVLQKKGLHNSPFQMGLWLGSVGNRPLLKPEGSNEIKLGKDILADWQTNITFGTEESTKIIEFKTVDDNVYQGDRQLYVTLYFQTLPSYPLYDKVNAYPDRKLSQGDMLSGWSNTVLLTIKDNDQPTPTYSLIPSSTSINEGSTLTTTVNTTNVASGTALYYSLSGTGVTTADFSSGSLTGSGTVSSGGSFSFSHTLANDLTTEGSETLQIRLFTDSSRSTQVASTTVSINDTSLTPTSNVTVNGTNNGIANAGTINNNGTINTGTINTNSGNTTNNITNTTVYNTNIAYNYYTNTTNNVNSNNTTTNVSSNNTLNTWNIFRVDATVKVAEIVNQWFGTAAPTSKQSQDVTDTKLLDINASTWSDKIQINRVAKATDNGDILEALMPELGGDPRVGSVLNGGAGKDVISGRAGWDVLDGGDADDLIHGGNGRDIITGGAGRDELHGDFGWNTYKSEKDGVSDLIAIKSDQYLSNWIYGKAGNNADGSKCDIIEGLDVIDKIRIIGVDTRDITFAANVTAKGLTGIGIYGKGALEALYTGGDLTINQITQMTSGDASAAAMANQVNSYGTW
jgi:hypothetical protein